jgi:ATP-dependent helicase/nuclease subunit A
LWFGAQGPKSGGLAETSGERSHLRWRRVDDAELADAMTAPSGQRPASAEPPPLASSTAEKLREVLNWEYPHGAATRRKAKASVTELRRAAEDADETAEPLFPPPALAARLRKPANAKRKLNAAESGTAHHTFLQHVALDRTGELAAEADRLVRENLLPAADRASLDLAALAAFWDSKLGRDICRHAAGVRRELPFTARFRAAELAGITGGEAESELAEEYILVQGVADLVVLRPEEIWVVDFKTDAVRRTELPDKLRIYQPQLLLYARALEKIYARPVRQCWLHFLALRHSEPVV